MNNKPLLLFVHLRKTAGTTVSHIMRRQFRRDEVVDINAPTVELANQQWQALSLEKRAGVKGVRGHIPFAASLFAPRKVISFTILRDPVERVVSEYYFNLRNAGEKFHAILSRQSITLDHFVESEISKGVHNTQTHMLSGAPSGASPQEMLAMACANLHHGISAVGISESFDASLILFGNILGWKRLVYRPINVNRARPAADAISPETVAAIEKANSLDRQLYEVACARFKALLCAHSVRQSQIDALRRTSLAYGVLRRVLGMPREVWIEAQMALARHRVATHGDSL